MRTLYIHSPQPLFAFAESCFALTPKVSLIGAHDLYLEIDSTKKALGGEPRLLLKAEQLADQFLSDRRRMVLVDRPEWAQAFLQDQTDLVLPIGKSAASFAKLSLDRLVWVGDPSTLEADFPAREKLVLFMKKVGLRTIADFLALAASAVHRRFGKEGEVLQDWAAGKRQLCLPPFTPEQPIAEKIDADDLFNLEALLFALRQVLIRVQARLEGRARAAKKIQLTFNLESHDPVIKILELTAPEQSAQVLLRVLREFLNGFHWESPLVRLELTVTDMVSHLPGQLSLLDDSENKFYDLAQYVGRLRARLGEEQVGFASLKPSYLPERSYALCWPPTPAPEKREGFPRRPLFLYTTPKPFQPSARWELTLTENLNVEWWEPGGTRQYFIARNGEQCLWVYRDSMKGTWFTHGSFD